MTIQVTTYEEDYGLSDEQARTKPFGPKTHAIQHGETLDLGVRLNTARKAVASGTATTEDRKLLRDIDAAMGRAIQSR